MYNIYNIYNIYNLNRTFKLHRTQVFTLSHTFSCVDSCSMWIWYFWLTCGIELGFICWWWGSLNI